MLNTWYEYYILFSVITSIFSIYKLYIPSLDYMRINKQYANVQVLEHPVLSGILFFMFSLILSPLFFIISLGDHSSKMFIEGFARGISKT